MAAPRLLCRGRCAGPIPLSNPTATCRSLSLIGPKALSRPLCYTVRWNDKAEL
jgi:hypothetical protein